MRKAKYEKAVQLTGNRQKQEAMNVLYTYILTFGLNNLQGVIDVYGKQCDLFNVNLVGLWWEEVACFKKVYSTAQKHVMIEVKAVKVLASASP